MLIAVVGLVALAIVSLGVSAPVPIASPILWSQLPVPDARSITALARRAGLRPNTVTSWWSKGFVPDNTSLRLLADAFGVELSDLVAAYEGSSESTWTFTSPELETLIDRAVDTAVRRVLAERGAATDE